MSSKFGHYETIKTYSMNNSTGKGGQVQTTEQRVWIPNEADERVKKLCAKYNIEEHVESQLDKLMMDRQDTFDEDIRRLYNDLERCRNTNGMLITKIKQMREGTFVGQWAKPDPEITHFSKKFKLDTEAVRRLSEAISRHTPEMRQKIYIELELHLDESSNPSALVMMFLRKIANGESLGPVEPRAGGKGKKGKGESKDGDDRDRDGERGRGDDRRNDRREDRDDRRDDRRDRDQRGGRGEDARHQRHRSRSRDRGEIRGRNDADRRDRDYGQSRDDRDTNRRSDRNNDRDRDRGRERDTERRYDDRDKATRDRDIRNQDGYACLS